MRITPQFKGKVKDGKIVLEKPDIYRKYIEYYLKPNQNVTVSINDGAPKRSSSQNNYYWAYLHIVADETGEIEHNLHEYFRRTLLQPEYLTYKDKRFQVPRSTTTLTKAEMSDYLLKIEQETEVPLPDPELAGYIQG